MRPIETSSRIRTAALLAAFAIAACGGGDPAEEAGDSGIAASDEANGDAGDAGDAAGADDQATGGAVDPATGDPAVAPTGTALPATVLQVQEANAPGLQAELTEVTRKDGVLTVKIRFRNTGTELLHHNFDTHGGTYEDFYLTAGTQKYFVLKDTEGEPLAPKYLTVNLDPGATSTWWAKFPAPPVSETTIDLVIPDAPPFEDVPITDR